MNDAIQLSDGESCCRVAEAGGERRALLLELGPAGARLGPGLACEPGSYVDCILALRGRDPRPLFANVVERSPAGCQLRWMFFEPGDEESMRTLIAELRQAAGGGPAPAHSTRRVIKPTGGQRPVEPAAPESAEAPPQSGRTRRIVKPSAAKLTPVAEAPPASGPTATGVPAVAVEPTPAPAPAIGEESGATRIPVALATTDRFSKLDDLDADDKPSAKVAPSVGADGRMDVAAALKSRAKTVRASELAARHEKVRVLNFSTIRQLIQEAVEEAAGHLTRSLGEEERKRLLKEAEVGFQERMAAFEAEKLSADARSAKLADQLKSAQDLLEQERKRAVSADQFTISAAGLEALDDQLRRGLDRAIAGKGVTPELEEQLRKLVAHLLDSEREKMKAKEEEAQSAAIALLEKKIGRLTSSLEDAERQRDEAREFAAMVEASGGGAISQQKFKAGIKGEDPNKRRKLELMKELAEQNRELRRALGIALNAQPLPAASDPPPAAPAPEPAAEPASTPAPAAPAAAEASPAEPGEALPNPDDAPWQPPGDATPEPNPDDLPWEPPAAPAAAAPAFRRPGAS